MFRGLSVNLFLQAGRLESEQELLNVVFSQPVDAPSVDGSPQKLVHLILGVHGLLNATAEEIKSLQGGTFQTFQQYKQTYFSSHKSLLRKNIEVIRTLLLFKQKNVSIRQI